MTDPSPFQLVYSDASIDAAAEQARFEMRKLRRAKAVEDLIGGSVLVGASIMMAILDAGFWAIIASGIFAIGGFGIAQGAKRLIVGDDAV